MSAHVPPVCVLTRDCLHGVPSHLVCTFCFCSTFKIQVFYNKNKRAPKTRHTITTINCLPTTGFCRLFKERHVFSLDSKTVTCLSDVTFLQSFIFLFLLPARFFNVFIICVKHNKFSYNKKNGINKIHIGIATSEAIGTAKTLLK